ncbi:MAG: alkylhydroperoxidase, partial [Acidobacteria bacterium]
MTSRLENREAVNGALEAMLGLEKYLAQSGLEPVLLDLVRLRASQINGCAYCL